MQSGNDTHTKSNSSSSCRHPKPPMICDDFVNKGVCKYGERCKYSHDLSSVGAAKDPNNSGPEEDNPRRSLSDLSGIVNSFSRLGRFLSRGQFEYFLKLALKALDPTDRDIQSKALELLSTHNGPDIIRYITEGIGNSGNHTQDMGNLDFYKHMIPFIKILVHEIFTKICVEKNLLYVVKAVYGATGDRAERFLTRLVTVLSLFAESTSDDESKRLL